MDNSYFFYDKIYQARDSGRLVNPIKPKTNMQYTMRHSNEIRMVVSLRKGLSIEAILKKRSK